MIRPPGWSGVAFSEQADGDLRADVRARRRACVALEITEEWATASQVHGSDLRRVEVGGDAGEVDAIWTTVLGLPVAVFTADCYGIVLQSDAAVGVAHAGWRGAEAGVVERLRSEMVDAGHPPVKAGIGPGIGACCFEVGPEVAERFARSRATTTWGTASVDLGAVLTEQLAGLETWALGGCTFHDDGWFSHRKDGTASRLAAIGWIP